MALLEARDALAEAPDTKGCNDPEQPAGSSL
jgi:hypothetical protein